MQKKILLVEDDKDFRAVLKAALSDDDYDIYEATNGEDGHDAIDALSFDLVIVDGSLADMDGITFIRELRLNGFKMPIMFVATLWRDSHAHRKLDELDVKVILHKPLDPMLIANHVDHILKGTPISDISPFTAQS
jgi:DNA-binding response OmpR family regulator